MSNLIPDQSPHAGLTPTFFRYYICARQFIRTFVVSAFRTLADVLAAAADLIGKAMGSAYVDPFTHQDTDRR